jgi:tetratricopeptide (TPR) repeat protein
MHRSAKLAIGLFLAALVVTGEGLLSDEEPLPGVPQPSGSALLEPARLDAGMKPIDEVIALWTSRSEADPEDYLSRTQLGSALLRQARATGDLSLYGSARAAFEDALRRNPRHPAALLGLGATRAADHDFAGQLVLAEQVLARDPESLPALAAVGDAQLELGAYDAAARSFGRLAAEERTAPVVSRLARVALIDGRTDEAVALAAEAAALARDLDAMPETLAQHQLQLGHHRYEAGDVEGASAALEQALRTQPGHLGALELLAQVRVAQERDAEAIGIYEDLLASGPAADLHGSVAALYRARGDIGAADRHVEAGLALARATIDRFPAERRHLAGFFARHDPPLALVLADADLATRQDVYAHDLHAWALFRNGRFAEADAAARRALARGTQDAELLYHAGMIAESVGDEARARTLLDRALDINPRFDVVEASVAREALGRVGGPGRPPPS